MLLKPTLHLGRLRRVFDYHQSDLPVTPVRMDLAGKAGGDTLSVLPESQAAALCRLQLPESAVHILAAAPLSFSAWTSARLSSACRERALSAAEQQGIAAGTAVWQTLSLWLHRRPDHHLLEVWEDYVGALGWVMSATELLGLQAVTHRRCQAILTATCGCVGIRRFQPHDHPLLHRLNRAFCIPAGAHVFSGE